MNLFITVSSKLDQNLPPKLGLSRTIISVNALVGVSAPNELISPTIPQSMILSLPRVGRARSGVKTEISTAHG